MSRFEQQSKFFMYGDGFLKKLCPFMKIQLNIEVMNKLILEDGTARKLHKKLFKTYNRENREKKTSKNNDIVVIMVGTYDIMKYKESDEFQKFSKRLCRDLTLLVIFLTKYHKHLIILTALPILKMQKQKEHWMLLRNHKRNIERLARRGYVRMVDLFTIFLKTVNPPRCNHRLYLYRNCAPKDVHVMWNDFGMRIAFYHVREAVANVQKLDSSNVEKKIKELVCCDRAVMTSKYEDVCIADDGRECTAVNYFSGGSVIDRNTRICMNQESGQTGYIHSSNADSAIESIYNSNTIHLTEDIKQKLSWIRFTDYSNYGKELVKTNNIKKIENEILTVATYNVLSQDLLEKHNYLYSQHDHRSLNWSMRRNILLEEFSILDADILCLQEIDFHIVEPFYDKFLHDQGYQGVYKRRTHDKIDGCAIYFKRNKFNLVESLKVEFFKESVRLLDKDNVGLILKLSLKNHSNAELIVATTHLLYNPKRTDIKLAQTQVMLAEIERLAYKRTDPTTGQPEYLPIIFTGDMNYSPESAIYRLVTGSQLEYEGLTIRYRSQWNEPYVLRRTLLPASLGVTDSCQYASILATREGSNKMDFETGKLNHHLNLASVYDHVKKDQPEATTNQGEWLTVDYIFYSRSDDGSSRNGHLKLISKLSLPNIREAESELRNIPNLACASDHLPLLATFHITGS